MAKVKKPTIQPMHDRVIVRPLEAESISKGGIIIPDSAKEKPMVGVIYAAGKGKDGEPMTVKVGDHVLFGKYAGTEIPVEGEKDGLLIMRESDCLAILPNQK